jgi:hypothetical protein
MVDADLAVVRLIPLTPHANASGIQTFLRQWASSVEEIKLDGTRDNLGIWYARLRTSIDKAELPGLIQRKAFDRHPVQVFMMPISRLPFSEEATGAIAAE